MAESTAEALIERMVTDEAFAAQLDATKHDAAAVQAIIAAAGYDVTPDEVRDAFLDRFGDRLDEQQLAAIAGGLTDSQQEGLYTGLGVATFGIAIGVSAAAAAI